MCLLAKLGLSRFHQPFGEHSLAWDSGAPSDSGITLSVAFRSGNIARPLLRLFALACASCTSLGCIHDRYQYGLGSKVAKNTSDVSNPITVGGDHPKLDRIERAVQYPISKLRKWFQDPKKPQDDPLVLQQQSLDFAREYLVKNELQDVQIDIREYAPRMQWERIKANPRIAPFWKYTGGALSVATYSIFPGRVFHSDSYNPYSNTLSLNSSQPTAAIYEAALAKQHRSHYWQGTYAILQNAPIFPVVHHAKGASDVLTYARVNDQWDLEKKLYPYTYANLGAATVMEGLSFVPASAGLPFYTTPVAIIAASAVGGASGMAVAKQKEPYVMMARERNRSEGVSSLFR